MCVNESVVIFRAAVTLSDVILANYGSLDKLIVCLSSFTESEVMTICRSITDVVVDLIKRVDLVLFYKASRRGERQVEKGFGDLKGCFRWLCEAPAGYFKNYGRSGRILSILMDKRHHIKLGKQAYGGAK